MFEDSLLNGSQSIATRRTASTVISLAIQTALLATIIALPLFTTEGVTLNHPLISTPLPAPPRGLRTEPAAVHGATRATTLVPVDSVLRPPRWIPRHVNMDPVILAPQQTLPASVPGGDPNGRPDGLVNSIMSSSGPPPPLPPRPAAPRRLVISHYDPGMLIRRVTPVYPRTAVITRTEGAVVLRAIVGKDGEVRDLRVVSGSPLLVEAALDAVRQWQFKPYVLNGSPIEIETQVTVNFVLNR
jgi:periplasmic protein TonB